MAAVAVAVAAATVATAPLVFTDAPGAPDEPNEPGATAAMRLELGNARELLRAVPERERPRLDLLLAMPRPSAFARMLPMISSMGVANLWLTGARRVEKAYWSSHLLRAGNVEADDVEAQVLVAVQRARAILVDLGEHLLHPIHRACHP